MLIGFSPVRFRLPALAMMMVLCSGAGYAEGRPHRIVSMNLCTDELVLRLADSKDIAAVTWLAHDPHASNVADLARPVAVNHGLAEEIIPLQPDLVLAGRYTTRMAVGMLRRVNAPVVELGLSRSVEDVKAQILQIADLVGHRDRGEAMVRAVDDRMAALGPSPSDRRPTALVLNPNGFTSGAGSLIDDLLTRAGLDNVVRRLNLGNYSLVPLEVLVKSDVDVLIVSASGGAGMSLATQLLKHPIVEHLAASRRVVRLPSRLWSCGGPEVVDVVTQLRRVVDEVGREGVRP